MDAARRMAAVLSEQLGTAVELEPTLVPTLVSPEQCLSSASAFALLDLAIVGHCALLEMERPVLHALLDKLSAGVDRPSPPVGLTRIEEAACGYLALLCLAGAREGGRLQQRLGPRLLAVHGDRSDALARVSPGLHLAIDVLLRMGTAQGLCRLLLPAASVLRVAAPRRSAAARPPPAEMMNAAIQSALCGGRAILDTDSLADLASGDVVVFSQLAWDEGGLHGAVRLCTKAFHLHGQLVSGGLVIQHARARARPEEVPMRPLLPDATQPFPPLPVELEIELKRVALTIGELHALEPGAVLPLRVDLSEPVLLRLGDRAVARAELVDIDGEVGARVLEMLP